MPERKGGWIMAFVRFSLFIGENLYGQATGRLLGTVSDTNGAAVIPGAAVTVVSEGPGVFRVVKTDDTGHCLVPLLPVGT
jgi:hypothetical protein